MLIVNADDWGGWKSATDAIETCARAGRVSSVSAMVFMEDSERGAERAAGLPFGVGLHLNLNQELSSPACPPEVRRSHRRIMRFLRRSRYALLLFQPLLRGDFRRVFEAQQAEFQRLYGRRPTHIDGHRHMHLCTNLLVDRVLPPDLPIRRSFSFWPGEKSFFNRAYRAAVDRRIQRFHRTTRYFFALSQCLEPARFERVVSLARTAPVELMTHPEAPREFPFLLGDGFAAALAGLQVSSYAALA